MNADTDKYTPPEPSDGDHIHGFIKTTLGTFLTGYAAKLFDKVIAPPLTKRRNKWMNNIAEGLRKLEKKKAINFYKLTKNETFLDSILMATQIALRTNQKEKLLALHNAVLNSSLMISPDESLQQIFLNYIDIFTVWHIKILVLVKGPKAWAKRNNHQFPKFDPKGKATLIESAFPDLQNKEYLYEQIWKDLYDKGLVESSRVDVRTEPSSMLESNITSIGSKFIAYITNPLTE